ncbi:Transcriptional regulator, IclR family [Pseudonocardia sp. Ae168_Ps1]|uniref:IclR family transcriptional regulator n=1 Tax=unclassified Pseudonocardia TaxID=2619320 RepID=UPI0001FFE975|nr:MULTISPECIES: IclR family transcriptional regulator [unclassified Pseudonocardia]ALE73926.1 IclR family transcriptional regulator [Pseudonocardia sp. EC080625-04]ALL77319.1 IclR family transcriptional regulator [Pseudonocardia sp. EC080610-09]ALL80235.1 IclR family transcriptional regulator [Pseudonocardia sp. EC080619-01]OLL70973.1 Transcriptional regulator, IclR family [Pseudonocardia sp. Ae168_Ps1]OLL77476.1 Transcriptional regulator, IclR family [Pseudonocardia sp. Ae150A_Ps1]
MTVAGESRETVGSVLRACRLLEHFGADRPVITLAELTAASGLNKPTVHRLMTSFVEAGWVHRDAAGAYRIRMPVFAVGAAALAEFDLRTEARPALEELAARFGDTAFLMVPADAGAVCIDRVEGGKPLVVAGIGIGTVLPYHAAAAPVVMAAFDPALRERVLGGELRAFTGSTHVDPAELAAHLDEARASGIAVSRDDYLGGVSAVAAPILGADGALVATVSLGGRSEDFTGPDGEARAAAVAEAGRGLSTTIGARPA